MAREMHGDGMYWLEEPVWPPEEVHGLRQVREVGVPIAAGENVAGLYGFKALVEAGAIDVAQPSVIKLGGIGETMRVATLCEANGVEVVPHCPYFGPGFIATLHRSEEHTSELPSLMRISYAVFFLTKKKNVDS